MLKVVLDTNVLISAVIFSGKPRKLLDLVLNNIIKAFISPYIIFELKEVLYKKFDFSQEKKDQIEELLIKSFTLVYPKQTLSIIKECLADNRILECAVEANADYLISGDIKHILKLTKIDGVRITSADEFLEIIKKSGNFGMI
jgi:putative PIN family toxin of toxin-antitoxin system